MAKTNEDRCAWRRMRANDLVPWVAEFTQHDGWVPGALTGLTPGMVAKEQGTARGNSLFRAIASQS